MNTASQQLKDFNQDRIDRIIRLEEVKKITCKSKTTIYKDIAAGTFPAPLKIGVRAVAWRLSEIKMWLENLQPAMEA